MFANKLAELADVNYFDSGLPELRIAYANAMWSWARVEAELFTVYVAALKAYKIRFRPLQHSYFSIVSAKTRLDMTNVAAKMSWEKTEHLEKWLPLADRCRSELRTRGRIAHLEGTIVYPTKEGEKKISRLMEHNWHPAYSSKYAEKKNKGISADQLETMRKAWQQLGSDISNFTMPIWEHELKLLEASVAPASHPTPATLPPPPQKPRKRAAQRPPSAE